MSAEESQTSGRWPVFSDTADSSAWHPISQITANNRTTNAIRMIRPPFAQPSTLDSQLLDLQQTPRDMPVALFEIEIVGHENLAVGKLRGPRVTYVAAAAVLAEHELRRGGDV